MKIVVIETDGTGGMCHYAYMMCQALAEAGADVTLVTSTDYELHFLPHSFTVDTSLRLWPRAESSRPLAAVPSWIRVPALTVRRGWRAVKLFVEWWRLTSRLRGENADVIQLRKIIVPGPRLIRRRLDRTGAVIGQVVHEVGFRDERGLAERIVGRFEQRDFAGADVIFVHNEFVRDQLVETRGVERTRTEIIAHGEGSIFELLDESLDREVSERYRVTSDDQVVLMFGEIRPSKGTHDLIRAMSHPGTAIGRARAIVVGKVGWETDPQALVDLADDLGVADRVSLDFRYVPIGEVAALMRRANVVVFPYRSATQSGVLAAALTFGKPVVVSAVGGLPDVVEAGHNGIVVPAADPVALANAIDNILGDETLASEMSAASLRLRNRYSWSSTAATMLETYHRATEDRSTRIG